MITRRPAAGRGRADRPDSRHASSRERYRDTPRSGSRRPLVINEDFVARLKARRPTSPEKQGPRQFFESRRGRQKENR